MIVLIEIIALVLLAMLAFNAWSGMRGDRRRGDLPEPERPALFSPGRRAADALTAFENVRSELHGLYPATFAMLGGYLSVDAVNAAGGVESSVRQMIDDWRPRRDEAMRELTRLLAENETEEEVRAIVAAACDTRFDQEGYRAWITWLLSRFNAAA